MKIVAAKNMLKANEQLAAENRARFDAAGVFCVNVVGSPGCGKTTLLEALLAEFRGRPAAAVIEGDIAGSIDAQRIEALGLPVVQINTDGACHLDANMIASARGGLRPGTDRSAADRKRRQPGLHGRLRPRRAPPHRGPQHQPKGDDKAVKYPAIFQGSDALVVTKTDLLAAWRFQPGADHGRHEALGAGGAGLAGLGEDGRGHRAGRRLAGRAVPGRKAGLAHWAAVCRPHSVLAVPLQRPARSSSPGVDRPGAGPATDARISLIVQRIVGHVFGQDAVPHVPLRPGGQGADLHQAEFLVPADDRRVGAGGALVAAHAGRPGVETGRHAVQHRHLAVEAASVGIALVDRPAVGRLVLLRRKAPAAADQQPCRTSRRSARAVRASRRNW